ncbi:MAG: hypothetical protein QGG74_02705 [Phycisphaerales bacterium]|nr:hypothetical protein [Phycisphaerales bacterium]
MIEPWTCMGFDGLCIRTTRWDICTTIMQPTLHARLPVAMESGLAAMRALFDTESFTLPEPTQTMTTCLMSDRRQWSNLSKVILPAHANAMQGLGRGGFTSQGVALLYDIDHRSHCRDTMALALHEGWHQYAQTALPGTLPHWVDEGLATIMEGFRLLPDRVVIDHASNRQRQRRAWWMLRRGRMQPLHEFATDDPHAAMDRGQSALLDYYGQAWAVMRFMLADPLRAGRVRDILAAAAAGRRSQNAELHDPALDAEFRQWCSESLRPGWWR